MCCRRFAFDATMECAVGQSRGTGAGEQEGCVYSVTDFFNATTSGSRKSSVISTQWNCEH